MHLPLLLAHTGTPSPARRSPGLATLPYLQQCGLRNQRLRSSLDEKWGQFEAIKARIRRTASGLRQ
ncbi:hypothetical protein SS50377_20747 [Spironucleus salmonicida]|uniref:Uncharacterized protein n=1 Tax=Spironucleus salmonicida TaxID=348837 RepID=V6LYW1_9EUKA|nr:hypothetical protein SS50377_20721 [Spironucleus salmonicida]KAH0577387.1 hypothetical protein SS50377_20739 [Spironucleus salmonicida]KAH0577395.1 hypothetical protein SS50377_20747 [Spironucleus salmonicida]|eukprot:EST48921.1 Hypothetical protein SS50377_10846 [Spironucleus salmonicida]